MVEVFPSIIPLSAFRKNSQELYSPEPASKTKPLAFRIHSKTERQSDNWVYDSSLVKKIYMYLEAMKSKSLYCDVQPGILQKDFFVGAPLRVPLLGYYTPTRSTAYICRGTSPFIDVPAGAAVLMPDDLTMKVKAHEKSPDLFTDRGYNCPILIAKLRDDKAEKNHTLLYHILGDEGISYQVTTTIQALKGRGLKGIEAVYSPREDSHIQDGILVVQDSAEFIRDMLNAFFTEVTIIERHDNEEAVALANNKKWCLFAGDNRMQDEWTVPEKKMTIERIAG